MRKKVLLGTKLLATALLLSGGIALSGDRAYAAELDQEVMVEDEISQENETGAVEINEENFPDAAFRYCVSAMFDRDRNGVLSAEEIANATMLACGPMGCNSFKGIEFFENLDFLYIERNNATKLDLSKNKNLVDVTITNNKLTTMNVAGLTKLKNLTVESCELQELNLMGTSSLEILYCRCNHLKELNLSSSPKLKLLLCSDNEITTLNIISCPTLVTAYKTGYVMETEDKIDYIANMNNESVGFEVSKNVKVIDDFIEEPKQETSCKAVVNLIKEKGLNKIAKVISTLKSKGAKYLKILQSAVR